jgi:putative aldouronate transport system substrate-binding protein
MKAKKLLATLLVAAMICSVLGGCGKKTESADSDNTATDSNGATTENSTEEPYTVTIYAPYDATTEACEAVSEKVSEITRELINCNVQLVRGVTKDQLNLTLVSGEKLDLFYAFPWEVSLSSMVASNEVVAMDDLLTNYALGTKESISEDDWSCVTVDGRTKIRHRQEASK